MTDVSENPTAVGTNWVDTRDMEWGSFPGLSIGRVKNLAWMDNGAPLVQIVVLPSGELGIDLPHRHEHKTVYEHAYHLSGDFPHSEWAAPDAPLETTYMREGYFLDRKPGSIHGNEYLFPPTATQLLVWRSGTGNWLEDEGAETETIDVEFQGFEPAKFTDALQSEFGTGIVFDRAGARLYATRDMFWEPLNGSELAKQRILVRGKDGEPSVRQIFIPAGTTTPVEELPKQEGDWEFAYLVEGELPVAGPDGPIVAKAGYFMTRSPGAPNGLAPVAPSEAGAMFMQFRWGPETFPFAD
jgi:hypothetical protein